MGICLNMIVRNEEKTLPRLFASLQGSVDYYVITDTGSTDNTIGTIKALGQAYGIAGEVLEHPWVDFAHNRNLALQDAIAALQAGRHQCRWIMIIDADEELVVVENDWKSKLELNTSYKLYVKTESFSYARLFLVWLDGQDWTWKGRVHNNLSNARKEHPKGFIYGVYIRYNDFEGAKSHAFQSRQEKALEDAKKLVAELADQPVSPENVHRFFQLAYSYLNAENFREAFDTMERVRASGYGSASRRYSVLIFLSNCLLRERKDLPQALEWFNEAIRLDPQRKEAYFYKASLLRKLGETNLAIATLEEADTLPSMQEEYLIREDAVYDWKIRYELSFLYFLAGNAGKSAVMVDFLLNGGRVPDTEKSFLLSLKSRLPA